MINLLRGEFYKLGKTKAIYTCCIIVVAFILFMYGIYALGDKMLQQQNATVSDNHENGLQVEIELSEEFVGNESVWDGFGVVDMVQTMFNVCSTIVTAIFVSVFIYAEYANGALKNIVGKGYVRWKVFLSKIIVTSVAVLIMQLLMVLAVCLFDIIFAGSGRITSEVLGNLLAYTGMQMILGAALTMMIIAINQFCRSLGAGVTISISVILFSDFISSGIDTLLKYFKIDVKFSDYWIPGLIGNCPIANIESDVLIRMILSSIVWIIIAIVAGTIHFQKTDVK